MKVVLCPVCNGVGKVSGGFYNRGGDCHEWVSTTTNLEVCRSCNGKGWVEVSESDCNPIRELHWEYPTIKLPEKDYSRCPDCGGDRNSPGGTGCRMGSHYGSYCSIQFRR